MLRGFAALVLFAIGEGSIALCLHTLVTNPALLAEDSGYVIALVAVLCLRILLGFLKLGSMDAKFQGSTSSFLCSDGGVGYLFDGSMGTILLHGRFDFKIVLVAIVLLKL